MQVQLAGAGGAVGRAGDCVGVGHVGGVHNELGHRWKLGSGTDNRGVGWVDDGVAFIRWWSFVELGPDESRVYSWRRAECERGELWNEQVKRHQRRLV